jgi:CubicO group peptidase (beta-lactamase class C family)
VTGDLSMLLTATAVLRFVDQGTVDLDQPVQRYLPEFSIRTRFARAGPITVRQLLSHHSGLPAMMLHGMWTPTPEPLATFVAGLRDEYAAAPPGLVYSRSFPGYDVLGRMLAVLCHRPFADCLQERLLEPLDMRDSTFDARLDTASLAMHYWKEQPVASQTVRDVPAAGLRSSVADLARFVELIFAQGQANGQTILKAHSVAEMLRAQNTDVALDLDNRVGFAWRLSGVRFPQTRHVAWLANDAPFSRGRILIAPDQKLGVIVLTNSSGSHEAVRKVSERLMQLILEQRRLPVFAEPPATALTATGPAPTRADIEGDYATIMGLVRVRATDDRYRAELLGKTIDLLPQPVGLLEPEYRLLGLIPIPIANLREVRLTGADIAGRHLAVAYFHNIAHRFGERIRPVDLSEAWRKRLGVYRAVERDALLDLVKLGDVTLAYEDRLLMVRYRVPGWLGLVARVPVRPVSDTELVVEGTGWMAGDTVQARHDQLLRYSGYEFRRVAAP